MLILKRRRSQRDSGGKFSQHLINLIIIYFISIKPNDVSHFELSTMDVFSRAIATTTREKCEEH